LRASQSMAIFTGNRRKSVQPTQIIRIQSAVRPEPALTSATLRARSVHPTMKVRKHRRGKGVRFALMSFATPALSTTIPTVVSSSLSSVRMRQRTGKAVIEYATPVGVSDSERCVV
jgi:hypothetical protein